MYACHKIYVNMYAKNYETTKKKGELEGKVVWGSYLSLNRSFESSTYVFFMLLCFMSFEYFSFFYFK